MEKETKKTKKKKENNKIVEIHIYIHQIPQYIQQHTSNYPIQPNAIPNYPIVIY